MPAESRHATAIKEDGWRQGSALPVELADALACDDLLPWALSPNDVVIVLSQDCDVTNPSLSVEPSVELLRLKTVSTRDGNLDWGKNPRRYQFTDSTKSPVVVLEASVHDRAFVPRDRLIGYKPNAAKTLDNETRSRLCRWIAARYVRAAFPDSFNRRTEPVLDQLRALFKSKGQCLSGLYLLLIDDELPDEEDYGAILVATMIEEHYSDPGKKQSAEELLIRVEAIFGECSGLDLTTELRSEAELSVHDLRKLKRWDFDDLSLRRGWVQELPPNP